MYVYNPRYPDTGGGPDFLKSFPPGVLGPGAPRWYSTEHLRFPVSASRCWLANLETGNRRFFVFVDKGREFLFRGRAVALMLCQPEIQGQASRNRKSAISCFWICQPASCCGNRKSQMFCFFCWEGRGIPLTWARWCSHAVSSRNPNTSNQKQTGSSKTDAFWSDQTSCNKSSWP